MNYLLMTNAETRHLENLWHPDCYITSQPVWNDFCAFTMNARYPKADNMKCIRIPDILVLVIALTLLSCTKNDPPVIEDPAINRDIHINSIFNIINLDDGFLVRKYFVKAVRTGENTVRFSKIPFNELFSK